MINNIRSIFLNLYNSLNLKFIKFIKNDKVSFYDGNNKNNNKNSDGNNGIIKKGKLIISTQLNNALSFYNLKAEIYIKNNEKENKKVNRNAQINFHKNVILTLKGNQDVLENYVMMLKVKEIIESSDWLYYDNGLPLMLKIDLHEQL